MFKERLIITGFSMLEVPQRIAFIAYGGVLGAKDVDKKLAKYSKKELKAACKLVDELAASEPVGSRSAAEIRASKKIIQRVLAAK